MVYRTMGMQRSQHGLKSAMVVTQHTSGSPVPIRFARSKTIELTVELTVRERERAAPLYAVGSCGKNRISFRSGLLRPLA